MQTDEKPIAEKAERQAHKRHYLMCRPDHFTVSYQINPWMHPENPTDTRNAVAQWEKLYETYLGLGHEVELIEQVEGLPDMVYTANGGFTIDNKAYIPEFRFAERQGESEHFARWFRDHGFEVVMPKCQNEGEGDFLLVGDTIYAGTGFRSNPDSHREIADIFGKEVVSLTLNNPNFYHLDTAFAAIDPIEGDPNPNIAYLESAFDEASLEILRDRFPAAVLVSEEDAKWLGLNSISDGRDVVIAARAKGFEKQLADRGYNPIGVDLSELLLGGGGVKCCTLELRR